MENNDETVGRNLRRLREARGLSQAELAQALTDAGLPGFHPQTITKIEKGVRAVKLVEGVPLARILGVEPEALLETSASALSSAALHRAVDKLIFTAGVAHAEISSGVDHLLKARAELEALITDAREGLGVEKRESTIAALAQLTVDSAIQQGLKGHTPLDLLGHHAPDLLEVLKTSVQEAGQARDHDNASMPTGAYVGEIKTGDAWSPDESYVDPAP